MADMVAKCFNPCFIGTYSITLLHLLLISFQRVVLILVLLELTLLLNLITQGAQNGLEF